jgi:hypothetical protein
VNRETYAIAAEIAALANAEVNSVTAGDDARTAAWAMGARYALGWVVNRRGADVPPSDGLVLVRQCWPAAKPEGTE